MTQQISTDDVKHLASLSAISLSDDELDSFRDDLERIISYIEQLGELDTAGVEPTYQVTGLENIYREDEVAADGISAEVFVDASHQPINNQFKVPKVL